MISLVSVFFVGSFFQEASSSFLLFFITNDTSFIFFKSFKVSFGSTAQPVTAILYPGF